MVDPKSKEREKQQSRYKYTSEIQQMMFVFGEVADPLPETTMLVEDIVRSQVIEIIILAAAQAQKRGSKNMNAEDLIFLIRRDRAKVNRLRTYLSWKDIRKNVKDSGGNDAAEEMLEDPNAGDSADKPKAKRMNVKLSWELASSFLDALNDDDDENDEDEREAYADTLQRLKDADEITRAMTRDEYVHYSECRQASFTYRKAKRFREWANMAAYIDIKPNDDIIDILGFLTFEMVNTLTETALYIKHDNDLKDKMDGKKENHPREPEGFLFSPPPSEQTPLQPQHIHEAFRRLQRTPQPIKNFRGGLARTKVSLI
ncbi:TFIID-18kDa-domain-containing protein [Basidiobolus meristosporus CBS 931.73]|uniref:TFIID-18kDa-domain-containing protein n=1 Tax=Basidiobolus meristosporus CBS 931.73 TaxID=1314790 RepID=A0A1Y1YMN4_9FUNG|nr:TFIID-18kDa-domain-containing protein [Basidiobolus meristosporus CBS 931.73]|eukprot:ORX99238.1 TFIID-18kDa-domain-containing protein [Basidiobolus meristosporus CBS 931.73]